MGIHSSESVGQVMNTILLLLLPLALALPAQDPLVQLESNQDFVIGSSCTIEAFDAEEKAKTCTIEHLPYFYDERKIWIESPTAPLEEVLQCFIEVVKFFDADGEVRQGVKDYLKL